LSSFFVHHPEIPQIGRSRGGGVFKQGTGEGLNGKRGGEKKVKGLSQWRLKAQAGGKRMQRQEVPLIGEREKEKILRIKGEEAE
jgi:hypothetical protein